MRHADPTYSYPSDVVYDAATVIAVFNDLENGSSTTLRWYVRPMGTYLRLADDRIDSTVPCTAMYTIEVIKMDYGSFNMLILEAAGPVGMTLPSPHYSGV